MTVPRRYRGRHRTGRARPLSNFMTVSALVGLAVLLLLPPFAPGRRAANSGHPGSVRGLGDREAATHPALVPAMNGTCSKTALTAAINCTGIAFSSGETFLAVVYDYQSGQPNVTSSSFAPTAVSWFANITYSPGTPGVSSSPSLFAMKVSVAATAVSGWANFSITFSGYLIVDWWLFGQAVAPVPRILGHGSQSYDTQPYDPLSGYGLGDTVITTFGSTRPTGYDIVYGGWNYTANPANPPGSASAGLNSFASWKWVRGGFSIPDPTWVLQYTVSWTALSFTVSSAPANALPTAPTGLSVTGSTRTSLTLGWTNPPGALANLTLWYSLGGCPLAPVPVRISLGTTASYTLTGLTPSNYFCFAVEAWNANGSSPLSTALTATLPPIYGYTEQVHQLPGFNPLSSYFLMGGTVAPQVPTLSSAPGPSFGVYYVTNSSELVELNLTSGVVRDIAGVIPLYQWIGYGGPLSGMLDNEFFLDGRGTTALFFGTVTSGGGYYSIELVDLASGVMRMWNTTAPVDDVNQQPIFVGNNTVIVISSNCRIEAYNLASSLAWDAGTVGANFGPGSTCFEANNIYWFAEKNELINVEAHHDTGDHVEQLNASFNSAGEIEFTSVATIAVDSGVVFNWVNGLAYNASSDRIAFSAGYWAGSTVYTYVVAFGANGLLTSTGELRYLVYDGGAPTGRLLNIQRYIYTSDYVLGEANFPDNPARATQLLFDPWNGSLLSTNRSFGHAGCGNSCFEGQYAASPDYQIDFAATLALNAPMYRVVYAYHAAETPPPAYTVTFTATGLPSGHRWNVTLNGSSQSSTGASIVFSDEPAGSYGFSVGAVSGYSATPSSGRVSVVDRSIGIAILFRALGPALYPVHFQATGLPPGTNWSVTANGSSLASTGPVITFELANGTYPFAVRPLAGYLASPQAGEVVVPTHAINVTIVFTVREYRVTFLESGLPSGTLWEVTFGGASSNTTGVSILFSVANGTYPFVVNGIAGYTASPQNGSLTVAGQPLNEGVTFSPPPTSPPPTGSFLGLSGATGYLLVGGIVAAGAAAAGAAVYWNRRRRPPEPTAPGEP